MTNNKKNVLYALSFTAMTLSILFFVFSITNSMSYTDVLRKINLVSMHTMSYDVVVNLGDMEKGLGGRDFIPPNYGMLFAFQKNDMYGFWMKDMRLPIDILWLSDTGMILKIDASVATSTYPQVFYPPVPVRYVLETAAGESIRRGWQIGTDVRAPLPYVK